LFTDAACLAYTAGHIAEAMLCSIRNIRDYYRPTPELSAKANQGADPCSKRLANGFEILYCETAVVFLETYNVVRYIRKVVYIRTRCQN